ncbi:trans-sialidase, putative [Trypanosoma cruzi marinkellei]|uniref:Trans-sialidase, putative n=1 Tax=Trypanosoma cruzi marinkellei TaxID=85056 RepID=K2MUW0_TRYCR|nr:trans-sialidase, putative [Trypanosoma cruzi marinkellei]
MLSRVAVKAPRTHNRRCVTGSGGGRREGREREPQRPNTSRRVLTFAVLLLLVVMWMCCGTCGVADAVESSSGEAQLPQWVAVLVPEQTQVLAKDGAEVGVKELFRTVSLFRAGGVMAVIAEGGVVRGSPGTSKEVVFHFDIDAGYLNPAWDWSTLVAQVKKDTWRAHIALSSVNETGRVGVAKDPTTVAKGKKAFLLVRSYERTFDETTKRWEEDDPDIRLAVGEATQSKDGDGSGMISWGEPKSLIKQITPQTKGEFRDIFPGGGAGALMADGTLVFPLEGRRDKGDFVSMIIYSTDNGENWLFQGGMPPAYCTDPRITEWESGQILMIVYCLDGQKVYESLDMGKTWTKAVKTLSGVWVRAQPGDVWDMVFRVGALITATIEERKLMLYTQKRNLWGEKKERALYLWVTDNSRTFHVGPLFVEDGLSEALANALLYSDDTLHLLRYIFIGASRVVSLARLTEELQTIKSILSSWALLDASFSASYIPTEGLVGFLSDTAIDQKWIDEYRCVNATVANGVKVQDGFNFKGPGSGAIWPVNSLKDNGPYTFVDYDFTFAATVSIHQVPKLSTPLLGAVLDEPVNEVLIGLSYNTGGQWETVFNGTKTTQSSTWEQGRKYQVVLMLQDGNKGSVYVNGELVGSSDTIPTLEVRGREITHFSIGGAEGGSDGDVTLTNVFLYNRPLSDDELRKLRKSDGSMRGGVSRVLLLLLLGLWGFVALY